MGTFMGHAIPGLFFIVFAIWWTYAIFTRYYRSKYHRVPAFQNTAIYPITCCSTMSGCISKFPVEGLLKIIFCSIGLGGEIITALDEQGHFVHIGNGQHATMFSFFGLSGVVDLLVHYKFDLPRYVDYAFAILCFSVEGILFMFHLHGRSPLDVTVHKLLVYVIWLCVLTMLAEMRFPRQVLAGLARAYFVFIQGTWFLQVGTILYPPFPGMARWDHHNHTHIMLCTIIFAWHMFFIFGVMLIIGLSVARYQSRVRGYTSTASSDAIAMEDEHRQLILEDEASGSEAETGQFGNSCGKPLEEETGMPLIRTTK